MNYRLHGDQTKRNAKGMLMIYIQTCYINWIQTQNSCVTDKMRTDDHNSDTPNNDYELPTQWMAQQKMKKTLFKRSDNRILNSASEHTQPTTTAKKNTHTRTERREEKKDNAIR